MQRWNFSKVYEYVKNNSDAELLSKEYIKRDELLLFRCKCGNKFERSWRVFLRGSHTCKKCSWNRVNKDRKYTIDRIREYVQQNSKATLLSDEYKTCKDNLKFKCECGNVFYTTFDSFKNKQKITCNVCSILSGVLCRDGQIRPLSSLPKDNDTFLKELKAKKENKYIPLEKYETAKAHIKVQCTKCGFIWRVTPDKLLNADQDCPDCNGFGAGGNSKGSRKIEDYLCKNNIPFVKEKTFKTLKSLDTNHYLRFDFYLTNNNTCIEYDGEQHFKPSEIFGGVESFERTKIHDEMKNKFCKDNNIKLIRIPYFEIKNLDTILNKAIMSQAIESK